MIPFPSDFFSCRQFPLADIIYQVKFEVKQKISNGHNSFRSVNIYSGNISMYRRNDIINCIPFTTIHFPPATLKVLLCCETIYY